MPDDLSSVSWEERGGGSPVPGCDLAHYREVMRRSLEEPAEFWAEVASEITWSKPWKRVLDDSDQPFTKWYTLLIPQFKILFILCSFTFRFSGGELNVCFNAVDRHVLAGKGDKVALIHDSPVTNTLRKVTYRELQHQVR